MTQNEKLAELFAALLRAERPLVAERSIVSVGRQSAEFSISPRDCRVEIRFGSQAFGSPNLMQIIAQAAAGAEQLLMGAARASRREATLAELHEAGAPLTDGTQRLAKILLSRDRVKLGAAKDWLWDTEGIRASLRAEPHTRQWALRVPVECAQAARASIKLFNDEWRAAS